MKTQSSIYAYKVIYILGEIFTCVFSHQIIHLLFLFCQLMKYETNLKSNVLVEEDILTNARATHFLLTFHYSLMANASTLKLDSYILCRFRIGDKSGGR